MNSISTTRVNWKDIKNDSKGDVCIFIGSDLKNHLLLEGTMRMIDPELSLWEVKVTALDSIFNTREMKGSVIKTDVNSTFAWE